MKMYYVSIKYLWLLTCYSKADLIDYVCLIIYVCMCAHVCQIKSYFETTVYFNYVRNFCYVPVSHFIGNL
jgi:hypothetical protein